MRFIFSLLFTVLAFTLSADIQDKATGVSFPSDVKFDYNGKQYNLKATGVATRKKFFVKAYSVASYLQDSASGDNIAQEIMNDQNAKQLTIKWVHNAPVDKLQDGYRESLKKAFSPQEYSQVEKYINTYVSYFNKNVSSGDEHIIRWIPEGTIEVIINGNRAGTIDNKVFAKGLWSIWFGKNSVVNSKQLTSIK